MLLINGGFMKIDLSLTSKVKDFVNVSQSKTCEVILRSGRWVVDGKSILGVLSLDLSQPITLECDDLTGFEKFAVNE